jgi:hypothetical protein
VNFVGGLLMTLKKKAPGNYEEVGDNVMFDNNGTDNRNVTGRRRPRFPYRVVG